MLFQSASNPELQAAILAMSGAVLSLLMMFIPGFNTWYAALEDRWKPLATLGLNLLGAGLVIGVSCAGIIIAVECSTLGLKALGEAFFWMLLGNQLTYTIMKPATPAKVTQMKLEAKAARQERQTKEA